MELQRIKSLCERRKGGLRGLAIAVGMTEQNLHRCIRENKIQAGDLERIAAELAVDIDFFFRATKGRTHHRRRQRHRSNGERCRAL